MDRQPHCPDDARLRGLLDATLPSQDQLDLTAHLDACSCCQHALEELAAGGTSLPEAVREAAASRPPAGSALWPALESLENNVRTRVAEEERPEPSLDFLAPSDTPGALGRLSHFDVVGVIGRGGMGVVLHGFDTRLQRDVAVKVLDPALAREQAARKRFCREARAAASVTHEHVVAVHDVAHEEGSDLPFLVMQMVAGESLEDRLRRQGRLPLAEVVRVGMQAASGLAAAHDKGLIHRDVKPGNILLERGSGNVKLTDFGLARAAQDVRLTASGMVSGTPLYMSPEQARGEDLDHRADLFSLGVVLYEMATGVPPFDGKTPLAVLKRLTEEPHRPLRELNPAMPDWLAAIIDRLLAKDPRDRFQSARELAGVLEHHWAVLRTSSDEVPVCPHKRRRRRAVWAAVLLAVVGLGVLGFFLLRPGDKTAEDEGPTLSPTGQLSANAGTVWSVAFSPDGATLAMGTEGGTVKLWDTKTERVTATLTAHQGLVWVTAFAPDGKALATAGDDGVVKVWDLGSRNAVQTLPHPNAVRGLAFAPGGRAVVTGDRAGGLRRWDLKTGEAEAEAKDQGAIYSVAFSADGQTVATGGTAKAVRLWDAATLQPRLAIEGHAGPVYNVAFSPDGRRLASVGWDKKVHVWDVASGEAALTLEGHGQDVWAAAYGPDGRLATVSHDGTARLWEPSGGLRAILRGHTNTVHAVAFSRDGRRLATGGRDGTVLLWDVPPD